MRRWTVLAVFALLAVAAGYACADGLGVTAKLGTLGLGIDATVGLNDSANLRFGINAFSLDMDVSDDDDDMDDNGPGDNGGFDDRGGESGEIDLELKLMTIAALIDWYPYDSGFRLTGGIMLNNNEVDLSADPNEPIDFNERSYNVTDVSGTVGFNSLAPYIGIGYGNAVDKDGHWAFAFDFGVMFQGAPDVELSATASDPAQQAQLDVDLQAEIDDIEEDTDIITVYPVLSFGVSYGF